MTDTQPPPDPYRGLRRAAQVFAALSAVIFLAVVIQVWTARQVAAAREAERKAWQQRLMEKDVEILLLRRGAATQGS